MASKNSILRLSSKFVFAVMTPAVVTSDLTHKEDNSTSSELIKQRNPHDQRTFHKAPPAPNTSTKYLTPDQLTHEVKSKNILTSHPTVILGSGLTVAALMYMIRSSMAGDGNAMRIGAQYRIVAQLATFAVCFVCVLLANTASAEGSDVVKGKN